MEAQTDTAPPEFSLEAADGTGRGIVATHPDQMVTWMLWQACGDLAGAACVWWRQIPSWAAARARPLMLPPALCQGTSPWKGKGLWPMPSRALLS